MQPFATCLILIPFLVMPFSGLLANRWEAAFSDGLLSTQYYRWTTFLHLKNVLYFGRNLCISEYLPLSLILQERPLQSSSNTYDQPRSVDIIGDSQKEIVTPWKLLLFACWSLVRSSFSTGFIRGSKSICYSARKRVSISMSLITGILYPVTSDIFTGWIVNSNRNFFSGPISSAGRKNSTM